MNILIVDDHHLIRMGLQLVISETYQNATFVQAATFTDALDLLNQQSFQLVVLDVDIPGGDNINMIPQMRAVQPEVHILIYTGYDESIYGLPYISAGADGFVSKTANSKILLKAVDTILAGRKYVSEAVQEILLQNRSNTESTGPQQLTNLSPREMRVALLILEGKWTKEIAAIMNLQSNTISTYKKRIYDKLGVTNSIQLAKKISMLKNKG